MLQILDLGSEGFLLGVFLIELFLEPLYRNGTLAVPEGFLCVGEFFPEAVIVFASGVSRCGASARGDFSRQFWLGITRTGRFYRCKKCNKLLAISPKGTVWIYDNVEDFNRQHQD